MGRQEDGARNKINERADYLSENIRFFGWGGVVTKRLACAGLLTMFFMILLAACGAPKSTGNQAVIQKAGAIKVGTSADYPPFEYFDSNGEKAGFDIALMEEIAKRLGAKLEWDDIAFESLMAAVEKGEIDLAISAIPYQAEAPDKVAFSDPYYVAEVAIVAAEPFAGQIKNPADVTGYKVGVLSGSMQETWLMNNLILAGKMAETSLYRFARADEAAKDLENGRIEVWMADLVPAEALVEQVGGLKIVYQDESSGEAMSIIMRKDDHELLAAINDILRELAQEGIIKQLAMQYIGGMK